MSPPLILVVADEAPARTCLAANLTAHGYAVLTAAVCCLVWWTGSFPLVVPLAPAPLTASASGQ